MFVHPLERLLNPGERSVSVVVEDPQGDKIDATRDAHVFIIIPTYNPSDMGAMKTSGAIVIGVRIVLGKIPATHDSKSIAESASQRLVVIGDSGINHGNRLPGAIQTVVTAPIGKRTKGIPALQRGSNFGIGRFQRFRLKRIQPQRGKWMSGKHNPLFENLVPCLMLRGVKA